MSQPANVVATVLPIVAAAMQERVRRPLREAGATSPETAIAYTPAAGDRALFEQALATGEIKATLDGRLWLDTGRRRGPNGVAAIAVVCGAMVLVLAGLAVVLLLAR